MSNHQPDNESDQGATKGYYGLPVIHGPHWKWLIAGYFFFGGLAGGSAAIGSIARVIGDQRVAAIGRLGTYVSFAALIPCPVFLILDLGRPARFLNMLRAFRLSSPMSLGTWGLTAFGLLTSLSAGLQLAADVRGPRSNHAARLATLALRGLAIPTGVSGMFVAGYTGVLLAATAVPIWSKRPMLLAPLFLASAFSSGAAAISAVAAAISPMNNDAEAALQSFERVAITVEGALLVGWIASLGSTAKPISNGLLGYVVRGVVGALAAPLLISTVAPRLPERLRRNASLVASALTLAGALALRFVVVEAGRRSADDPMATFEMTG